MKERTSANVLRTIYMIITILFLIGALGYLCVRIPCGSKAFWRQMIDRTNILDALVDSVEDDIDVPEFLEDELDVKDLCMDYGDILIDETLEFFFDDDDEIDEDRIEDLVDEYCGDIIDDYGYGDDEVDDLIDSLVETTENYLDDLSESVDNDLDGYKEVITVWDLYVIGSAVVCAILLVISLIISRNKFLPLKATGIAIIVGAAINLAVLVVFKFVMLAVTSDAKDDIEEVAAKFINDTMSFFVIEIAVCLVAGIVLTIVFAILAKNKTRNMSAEIDETAEDFVSSNYTSGVESAFNPVSNSESDSDRFDKYSDDDLE